MNRKKTGVDFGKLYVANCITLATRVRSDILKAIARVCTVQGKEELYAAVFCSRPVLHVKDKSGNRSPYVLTYADAVTKYGAKLAEEDLTDAYRRAGTIFDGKLAQQFIVLKENQSGLARGNQNYQSRGRGQRGTQSNWNRQSQQNQQQGQ